MSVWTAAGSKTASRGGEASQAPGISTRCRRSRLAGSSPLLVRTCFGKPSSTCRHQPHVHAASSIADEQQPEQPQLTQPTSLPAASSSSDDSTVVPSLAQRPRRSDAAAAAAAVPPAVPPQPYQRPVPRPQQRSNGVEGGFASDRGARQSPSLRALLNQQRKQQRQPSSYGKSQQPWLSRQQQEQQAAQPYVQGQPAWKTRQNALAAQRPRRRHDPSEPSGQGRLRRRQEQQTFLTYSQQRQQQEQQHLMQASFLRQQQVPVPHWIREVAEEMLEAAAAAAIKAAEGTEGRAAEQRSQQREQQQQQNQEQQQDRDQRPEQDQEQQQAQQAQAQQQQAQQQQAEQQAQQAQRGKRTLPEGLLGRYEQPEAVLRELNRHLPPFFTIPSRQDREAREAKKLAAQQQVGQEGGGAEEVETQAVGQEEEESEGEEEEEAGDDDSDEEQQEQQPARSVPRKQRTDPAAASSAAAAAAAAADAGGIFAAELSQILANFQQSAAAQAQQEEQQQQPEEQQQQQEEERRQANGAAAATDVGEVGTEAAAASSGEEQARSQGGTAAADPPRPRRKRRLDEGGFVLLLRAVAILGDGMRSALAVLVAADRYRPKYPTRSHDVIASLLRLCSTLLEDEAAVVLVALAREWGVELDRPMWRSVLDVCAKAGKPDVVLAQFKEMEAEGLPPDAVAHTILVMAHEKAGRCEAALQALEHMRALGLERSSFTYRAVVSALLRADRLAEAVEMLDAMAADGVEGNAVIYQTLINAFIDRNQEDRVDQLLERMRDNKVRFNEQAVARLTGFCFSRNQPQLAFQLFKRVREMGLLALGAAEEAPAREGSTSSGSSSSDSDSSRSSSTADGALSEDESVEAGTESEAEESSREDGKEEAAAAVGSDSEAEEQFVAAASELLAADAGAAGDSSAAQPGAEAALAAAAAAAVLKEQSGSTSVGRWVSRELELPALPLPGGCWVSRGLDLPPASQQGWVSEGKAARRAAEEEREQKQLRSRARGQAAFCYCRMIAACHKARMHDEAWCVYAWMLEDGLRPDRTTYSRLISLCAHSPSQYGARVEALYDRMVAEGVDVDVYMSLHLVTALAAGAADDGMSGPPPRWPVVLRVLHDLHIKLPAYKDTHVQTVAVSMASRHGRLDDALAVYRLMLQDGVLPKAPTFNALIAACMRCGAPSRGFRFHDAMRAMGTQPDVVTISTLITCCERLGDWRRAKMLWDGMLEQGLQPDTICCNTLMTCMERCNQPALALQVFEQVLAAAREESSDVTFAALCDHFLQQGKWDKLRCALPLKEWLEGQGEDAAQVTQAELAERAAAEGGCWREAADLFRGIEWAASCVAQPNVVTYNAAIISCSRLADWRRARELKDEMLDRGIPAASIAFNSVLAACEAAKELEAGLEVLQEMRAAGVPGDQYTYSTLISCCQGPDHVALAMRLFREMQDEGLVPNTIVINALLNVCSSAGDADTAEEVFRYVTDHLGQPPDEITLHCMMEVMGRVGRWADGLRFFMLAFQQLGSYRGVMQLDLTQQHWAAQLDLHYLSVMGARIVLRAWLLYLKRRALAGERLDPNADFRIVTGWGRNSPDNVPRLKPEVGRCLQQELGPPLAVHEPPNNLGVYHVPIPDMYTWLLTQADLGYRPADEEEAWGLMQLLQQLQQQEEGGAGSQPGGNQTGSGTELDWMQDYEQVAWEPVVAAVEDSSAADEALQAEQLGQEQREPPPQQLDTQRAQQEARQQQQD